MRGEVEDGPMDHQDLGVYLEHRLRAIFWNGLYISFLYV